jgi:hypothetical protein
MLLPQNIIKLVQRFELCINLQCAITYHLTILHLGYNLAIGTLRVGMLSSVISVAIQFVELLARLSYVYFYLFIIEVVFIYIKNFVIKNGSEISIYRF